MIPSLFLHRFIIFHKLHFCRNPRLQPQLSAFHLRACNWHGRLHSCLHLVSNELFARKFPASNANPETTIRHNAQRNLSRVWFIVRCRWLQTDAFRSMKIFFQQRGTNFVHIFSTRVAVVLENASGTKGILRSSHSRCFQLRFSRLAKHNFAGTTRSNLVNVKAGEDDEVEASLKGCLCRESTVKSRDTLKIYFYFRSSLICDVNRQESKNHRFVHHAPMLYSWNHILHINRKAVNKKFTRQANTLRMFVFFPLMEARRSPNERQHRKSSANTPRECFKDLKNSVVDVITEEDDVVSVECLHASLSALYIASTVGD